MTLFVPGVLRNPLNGSFSRAHWRLKSQWANAWKDKTHAVLAAAFIHRGLPGLEVPKRITFTAQTGATWDDDAIPGGIKPCRDALIGYVIHSDAPDSGHQFSYVQTVNRKERGVRITIAAVTP